MFSGLGDNLQPDTTSAMTKQNHWQNLLQSVSVVRGASLGLKVIPLFTDGGTSMTRADKPVGCGAAGQWALWQFPKKIERGVVVCMCGSVISIGWAWLSRSGIVCSKVQMLLTLESWTKPRRHRTPHQPGCNYVNPNIGSHLSPWLYGATHNPPPMGHPRFFPCKKITFLGNLVYIPLTQSAERPWSDSLNRVTQRISINNNFRNIAGCCNRVWNSHLFDSQVESMLNPTELFRCLVLETSIHAAYSLSNVIMADEKLALFHQYLRYRHKWGTIVFSIPGAILWA